MFIFSKFSLHVPHLFSINTNSKVVVDKYNSEIVNLFLFFSDRAIATSPTSYSLPFEPSFC